VEARTFVRREHYERFSGQVFQRKRAGRCEPVILRQNGYEALNFNDSHTQISSVADRYADDSKVNLARVKTLNLLNGGLLTQVDVDCRKPGSKSSQDPR